MKKKTTKWWNLLKGKLVIGMIAALVLSLSIPTICQAEKDAPHPVTIRLALFPLEALTDYAEEVVIPEMEKLYPDVKVEVEMLTWQEGLTKLTTMAVAGTLPDLAYMDFDFLTKYYLEGVVQPIDGYLTSTDLADFLEGPKERVTMSDGKMYGWPWLVVNQVILANKEAFDEVGVELPGPPDYDWTIEEFLEAAKKVTIDRDGDGNIDVWAFQIVSYKGGTFLFWFWNFGAELYNADETRFTLNSPEGIEALQFLVDAQHKYKIAPKGVGKPAYIEPGQGEIAMWYSSPLTKKTWDEKWEEWGFPFKDLVTLKPPHKKGYPIRTYGGTGGFVPFNQAKTAGGEDAYRLKMTMELARLLTGPQHDKAVSLIGCFPARASSIDMESLYREDPFLQVAAQLAGCIRGFGTNPNSKEIYYELLPPAVQSALLLEKTPKEALDEVAAKANELLSE